MTYEQLLQLQYMSHKPIIKQPCCKYSTALPTAQSTVVRSSNTLSDSVKANNTNDTDGCEETDPENVRSAEFTGPIINSDTKTKDDILKGNKTTNIADLENTNNNLGTLAKNKEKSTAAVYNENTLEDSKDGRSNVNDNELYCLPQKKMDRNEKVVNFLKGLPEIPVPESPLEKCTSKEAVKEVKSSQDVNLDDLLRSVSKEPNYEQDFESSSSDTNALPGMLHTSFVTTMKTCNIEC